MVEHTRCIAANGVAMRAHAPKSAQVACLLVNDALNVAMNHWLVGKAPVSTTQPVPQETGK